jgi:hypothetical protein
VKTRTEMCAASFVILLVGATTFAGGGQRERGQEQGAVVATGLDNPRGLDWSHGRLFIAEAGTGGDGSCVPGIFALQICLGRTGAVTEVTRTGRQRRILKGLPSLAGPDGTFAYGPSDVSVKDGHVYVSIGGPNETRNRELLTEAIARKLGSV